MLYSKLETADLPYEELQQASLRINILNDTIDQKEMRWLELNELIS